MAHTLYISESESGSGSESDKEDKVYSKLSHSNHFYSWSHESLSRLGKAHEGC